MKRIDHFFKICELPKRSQSSADAAEPVTVMEEADSSGSAVVVASNTSNECDDEIDISRNWRSKGLRGIRSLRNSMSIENVWTHSENCS